MGEDRRILDYPDVEFSTHSLTFYIAYFSLLTAMKPSPLLEIKDLVTEFNTDDRCFKAVNNINLTINKGEVAGLVGESGAGKSTVALSILKLINSPDKITSGKLIYHTGSQSVDLIDLNEKDFTFISPSALDISLTALPGKDYDTVNFP